MRGRSAVLGVTVLSFAAVLGACTSMEDASVMPVNIINDTGGRVDIYQRGNNCRHSEEFDSLDPGESVTVNTSSENVDNW